MEAITVIPDASDLLKALGTYGLVAYWKFDEGAGKTIKDQTSYGNDLTVEKELKWVNVSLPELGK